MAAAWCRSRWTCLWDCRAFYQGTGSCTAACTCPWIRRASPPFALAGRGPLARSRPRTAELARAARLRGTRTVPTGQYEHAEYPIYSTFGGWWAMARPDREYLVFCPSHHPPRWYLLSPKCFPPLFPSCPWCNPIFAASSTTQSSVHYR